MFLLDEIKERINTSNHDAICNAHGSNPVYPKGMARLLNHIHNFDKNEKSKLKKNWAPKNKELIFDSQFLDLYRGAFARKQLGENIADGRTGRGREAISTLFSDLELQREINKLYSLSKEYQPNIIELDFVSCQLMIACEKFWDLCADKSVSPIYRSKTLSMVFPELFVPFDSASCERIHLANNEGKLPGSLSWIKTASNIRWEHYANLHKSLSLLINKLFSEYKSQENNANYLTGFRNLSCYTTCNACGEAFNDIRNDISADPVPLSRMLDKVFYTPKATTIKDTSSKSERKAQHRISKAVDVTEEMEIVIDKCREGLLNGEFSNKKSAAKYAFEQLLQKTNHSSQQVKYVYLNGCNLTKLGSNTYFYNFTNDRW